MNKREEASAMIDHLDRYNQFVEMCKSHYDDRLSEMQIDLLFHSYMTRRT